jgi:hypothetical protein
MRVHSILPEALTAAADEVLDPGGIEHVAHGVGDAMGAAEAAAADADAVAMIGPYRSADVAHAVEATAPTGLPLLAPVATWVGVTRDDEPGCEDPARHGGTVMRLVARDSEVARRLTNHVQGSGQRALVVAGEHFYGRQLDAQLRMAGMPRASTADDADIVVLAGLPGEPELEQASDLAPLPVVAFDGVQGTELGDRDVLLALPYAPLDDMEVRDLMAGVERARAAARLVQRAVAQGAEDRREMLTALRRLGGFDPHGDPPNPPVWLWRADSEWNLRAERPL